MAMGPGGGVAYVPAVLPGSFTMNPVIETVAKRTGCRSLTNRCQREETNAHWERLVKRRWALLESNPPRNSQPGTHRNDEPTRSSRRVVGQAAGPHFGRRLRPLAQPRFPASG